MKWFRKFSDPNMGQAVRESIEKPFGLIRTADLLPLTILDADWRKIQDLAGIQYCTNLTTLSLRDNQIMDLCPLLGLANLTELHLYVNQIVDVRPLADLANLTWLYLSENPLGQDALCNDIPALRARGVNVVSDDGACGGEG